MRGALSRWLAGAALLALVVLALLQWRSDRAAAPGTLLSLAPQAIDRIVLEVPGQRPQTYRKHDGHWWRAGSPETRVDHDERLERMAAIAAAPVQRWLAPQRVDLHTLGLKPPQLTLVLDGQRLAFGVMTPFEPGRYVRVGDRVAVIDARFTPQAAPALRVSAPTSP